MITESSGRHETLLPINYKNFNFPDTNNSQVMKKGKFAFKKTDKLSNNKLSDNNLESDLVENGIF